MPSALLLPVLTCAAVLIVSGVAKLRAPETVDSAFTSLEVPKALDTPFVRRLSPWVEVALGAWLLLATGVALVIVATLTLLLFIAYLVLVARAVRRPEPVDCGCFGALGDSQVTRVTVWRNAALVLSALLAVVAGLQGVGLIGAVVDGDALPWIATATLTAAVAALVTYRAPTTASPAAGPAARRRRQLRAAGDPDRPRCSPRTAGCAASRRDGTCRAPAGLPQPRAAAPAGGSARTSPSGPSSSPR